MKVNEKICVNFDCFTVGKTTLFLPPYHFQSIHYWWGYLHTRFIIYFYFGSKIKKIKIISKISKIK